MHHKIYQNGLNLITVPIKGTKTATIFVIVGTGSKYENKTNSGISHFLEHMMFKGTKKRPTSKKIVSEIDALGCEYNAFTSKEYTGYWIKVASSKLDKMSEVLSDMFFNSKFDKAEIKREHGVIIEEINMYEDNPMMFIEEIFETLLYGDTPAGWETLGTKENIINMQRKDFVDYINSQYGANNTTIVIAGDVSTKLSEAITRKYFNDKNFAKRGQNFKIKEKVIENQTKPAIKLRYKKTDQAHLCLGIRAFGDGHKNEFALKIMAIALGGSMSSRLFMNLRERNGLAYYVRTSDEVYTDVGYLVTQAGVPVNKIEKAIEIILREYKRFATTSIDAKELRMVKDMIKGRYAIDQESSENVATWYGKQAVMLNTAELEKGHQTKNALSLMTTEKYLRNLEKVDAKTIKQVAKDIFKNSGLNLAIIGPFEDEKKFEKILKF